jgi:hypothetical protein
MEENKLLHRANIGPTRCGKTYQALREAKRAGKPVLFVNPKNEDVPGFVKLDCTAERELLNRLLRKGKNINYVPHRNRKIALKELDVVIQEVFDVKNIFVVFDEAEVHGYEGLSFSPLFDVAERGLGLGVDGLYLIQDPAGVGKRILRQCGEFRIFAFNEFSGPYFTRLKYDVEKMQNMLLSAGKYSYIIIENGIIKGTGRE